MRRWYSFGNWSVSIEASKASPCVEAGFWLSEESGIVLHTRCPWWLSMTITPPWRWRSGFGFMRCTGVSIRWDDEVGGHALRVAAELMHDGGEWSRERDTWPLWRRLTKGNGFRWAVDLLDLVLGEAKYEEVAQGISPALVHMPEGAYDARVSISRVRWKRPRWFARWYWRNTIEIANGGLPFPGKGENSWDCDDDATHSVTFGVTKEPEAAHETAQKAAWDALKTRQRRGGFNWTPDKGWHPDVVARSAKPGPRESSP